MAKKQDLHMLPSPTLRKPRLWRFRQRWQSSLCPTENDLPSSGPACWQSADRSEPRIEAAAEPISELAESCELRRFARWVRTHISRSTTFWRHSETAGT